MIKYAFQELMKECKNCKTTLPVWQGEGKFSGVLSPDAHFRTASRQLLEINFCRASFSLFAVLYCSLTTVNIVDFHTAWCKRFEEDLLSKRCALLLYIDVYAACTGNSEVLLRCSLYTSCILNNNFKKRSSLRTNCHNIWVRKSGPITFLFVTQNPCGFFDCDCMRRLLVVVEFPVLHIYKELSIYNK